MIVTVNRWILFVEDNRARLDEEKVRGDIDIKRIYTGTGTFSPLQLLERRELHGAVLASDPISATFRSF